MILVQAAERLDDTLRDRVRAHAATLGAFEVCVQLGLEPRREGTATKVRCPVHDDRRPSCSVGIKQGSLVWHCFSCGAGGDAFDLVAAVERIDGRDFLRVLKRTAELLGVDATTTSMPSTTRAAPRVLPAAPTSDALNDADYARFADALIERCPLAGNRQAHEYVRSRGILDLAADIYALPATRQEQVRLHDELVEVLGSDIVERSGLVQTDPDKAQRMGPLVWSEHVLLIPWRSPGVAGEVVNLQRRLVRAPRTPQEPRYADPPARLKRDFRFPFGINLAVELLGAGVGVVYTEGALDALGLRRLFELDDIHDLVVVGVPTLKAWRHEWANFVAGRRAFVAIDDDSNQAGLTEAAAIKKRTENAKAADAIFTSLRQVGAEPGRLKPQHRKDWNDELLHRLGEHRV